MSNVYAEMSGVADIVTIKVGDMFTSLSSPVTGNGIRIVNTSELKAVVDVPENYLSRIRKGTPVLIEIPDLNRTITSTIFNISQVVSPTTRGFMAEARVPAGANLKPNEVAMMHIQDYAASNVVTVPVNAVQTDQNGKYVYLMVTENGKTIARKRSVIAGEINGDQIEIKKGLDAGDKLISEGYQSVYDGQVVTTETK